MSLLKVVFIIYYLIVNFLNNPVVFENQTSVILALHDLCFFHCISQWQRRSLWECSLMMSDIFLAIFDQPTYLVPPNNVLFLGLSLFPLPTLISDIINGRSLFLNWTTIKFKPKNNWSQDPSTRSVGGKSELKILLEFK